MSSARQYSQYDSTLDAWVAILIIGTPRREQRPSQKRSSMVLYEDHTELLVLTRFIPAREDLPLIVSILQQQSPNIYQLLHMSPTPKWWYSLSVCLCQVCPRRASNTLRTCMSATRVDASTNWAIADRHTRLGYSIKRPNWQQDRRVSSPSTDYESMTIGVSERKMWKEVHVSYYYYTLKWFINEEKWLNTGWPYNTIHHIISMHAENYSSYV